MAALAKANQEVAARAQALATRATPEPATEIAA
jgi:hypothetical protein